MVFLETIQDLLNADTFHFHWILFVLFCCFNILICCSNFVSHSLDHLVLKMQNTWPFFLLFFYFNLAVISWAILDHLNLNNPDPCESLSVLIVSRGLSPCVSGRLCFCSVQYKGETMCDIIMRSSLVLSFPPPKKSPLLLFLKQVVTPSIWMWNHF